MANDARISALPVTNLLGFDQAKMHAFVTHLGEKPFRAQQLIKWIHQRRVIDFHQMTDLSLALRHRLKDCAAIVLPEIAYTHQSKDGTIKWIIRLADGNSIETVYIPEAKRGTLCVSSQVGCMLTCTFCSTGKQGFNRNLHDHEIIGQVWLAMQVLSCHNEASGHKITNVVMMGMGEPLLNFEPVTRAMQLMIDDHAYGLARRRVTLSTSGVVPQIDALKAVCPVSLAVSLHAPEDALRNEIVPINRKYPLKMLMRACRDYLDTNPHKTITFEYVMLNDVNDQPHHAKGLLKLLANVRSKINLIPFNPFVGTEYTCSPRPRIEAFQRQLQQGGIMTTIRKTRGDDVSGACGQLVGKVQDKTTRQMKFYQARRQHVE